MSETLYDNDKGDRRLQVKREEGRPVLILAKKHDVTEMVLEPDEARGVAAALDPEAGGHIKALAVAEQENADLRLEIARLRAAAAEVGPTEGPAPVEPREDRTKPPLWARKWAAEAGRAWRTYWHTMDGSLAEAEALERLWAMHDEVTAPYRERAGHHMARADSLVLQQQSYEERLEAALRGQTFERMLRRAGGNVGRILNDIVAPAVAEALATSREEAAEAKREAAAHDSNARTWSRLHAEVVRGQDAAVKAAREEGRQAGRAELGREMRSGLVMLGMRPEGDDPLALVAAVGRALGERRREGWMDGHYEAMRAAGKAGYATSAVLAAARAAGLAYLRGEAVTYETLTTPAHPNAASAYSMPPARSRRNVRGDCEAPDCDKPAAFFVWAKDFESKEALCWAHTREAVRAGAGGTRPIGPAYVPAAGDRVGVPWCSGLACKRWEGERLGNVVRPEGHGAHVQLDGGGRVFVSVGWGLRPVCNSMGPCDPGCQPCDAREASERAGDLEPTPPGGQSGEDACKSCGAKRPDDAHAKGWRFQTCFDSVARWLCGECQEGRDEVGP